MSAVRLIYCATTVVAMAACLTACTPPSDSASGPSPANDAPSSITETDDAGLMPEPGDTIVWNLGAETAHMNPVLDSGDAAGRFIGSFIFEQLLKVDNDTLELRPNLAESWSVSDDKLAYTVTLRPDVRFSDGTPLTSADVKWTLEAINDPKNDTAAIRNYMQDIEAVEIADERTFTFRMKQRYFLHPYVVGQFQVMPKHIYETADLTTHPANRKPIGDGPYQFESWDTGQQIVLVRNPNYWGKAPMLDKWVFKFIDDPNAAFQVLERHEIDQMRFQPELWTQRTTTPTFEREFNRLTPDSPIPGFLSGYTYIGWNMRKPQFEDKRVRQALTMLLDRESVVKHIYHGIGTIISGPSYQKSPEYNQDVKPWPFDPARAAALLDEAGWVDSDRDGIRDKGGLKLEFELGYGSSVTEYDQLGTVYQEELKRAGIKLNLNPLEWVTFQERVQKRAFDACMLVWLTDAASDQYQLWHSSQAEAGSNYPGFKNAEVDKLLEDARLEFDEARRNAFYHRMHEVLHDEQPYTFLFSRPGLIALDKRFHGVKIHTSGIDPLEWWVPKAQQRYP